VRVGVHPVVFTPAAGPAGIPAELAALGRAADEAGLSDLLLMDHFLNLDFVGDPADPVPEGYTTLGFLAAHTARVRLGLLVSGVTYRHAGVLAHQVATLDVLSGGRAVLGLGAAWFEREHTVLGVPFPSLGQRFDLLEAALVRVRAQWDGTGPGTAALLRPVQRPRPRLLVGGGGERRTLRLVARYADASNLIASTREEVAHKLRVLDRHCAEAGRDPAEVTRTLLVTRDPFADLPAFLAELRGYADLGVSEVYLVAYADPVGFTRRVGEHIVPVAAGLRG
jgi:alkanesulfonate monooxygenase SsuD/methylene tetrahydromethanopterin reductase-like flavin-dependent oxidoreductase (luciferase family)